LGDGVGAEVALFGPAGAFAQKHTVLNNALFPNHLPDWECESQDNVR
jgi:hypothetical protein